MHQRWNRTGFTLVEVLIGTGLILAGGSALLLGMNYTTIHSEFLNQFQVAMNTVQGELEELMATSVDALWTDGRFTEARTGRRCVGEDANCNFALDPGEDTNLNGSLDPGPLTLPEGRVVIQIRNADRRNPGNPSMVDVHVAACWRHRGRWIGETDCQDDADANWWVDSPVMASTRVARKD